MVHPSSLALGPSASPSIQEEQGPGLGSKQ